MQIDLASAEGKASFMRLYKMTGWFALIRRTSYSNESMWQDFDRTFPNAPNDERQFALDVAMQMAREEIDGHLAAVNRVDKLFRRP